MTNKTQEYFKKKVIELTEIRNSCNRMIPSFFNIEQLLELMSGIEKLNNVIEHFEYLEFSMEEKK
jgi:hypothetical protein